MNPFTSTPEAAQFWREQQQSCEEARRLLCKTPEFGQFLAAGGTLAVVPDGFPISDSFAALLKDGDTVYATISFFTTGGELYCPILDDVARLTAWLTEARDGAKPRIITAADVFPGATFEDDDGRKIEVLSVQPDGWVEYIARDSRLIAPVSKTGAYMEPFLLYRNQPF